MKFAAKLSLFIALLAFGSPALAMEEIVLPASAQTGYMIGGSADSWTGAYTAPEANAIGEADGVDPVATGQAPFFVNTQYKGTGPWQVKRPFLVFPISGIPEGFLVDSLALRLWIGDWGHTGRGDDDSGGSLADEYSYIRIQQALPSDPTSLSGEDFDAGLSEPTASDAIYISAMPYEGEIEIPLDAALNSAIQSDGYLVLTVRGGHELEQVGFGETSHGHWFYAAGPGSANPPTLVVIGESGCGNGNAEVGEECDDGNTSDGDGCTHDCRAEVEQVEGQQQCIVALNQSVAKLATIQGKVNAKCIKNAAKGAEADPQACLGADSRGKVAKTQAKVTRAEEKSCIELPTFAYAGSGMVNESVVDQEIALAGDIFGGDLNSAVLLKSENKAGAKCQGTIVKDSARLVSAKLKAFGKCTQGWLEAGAVKSSTKLGDCLCNEDDPANCPSDQDPKDKIESALAKLERGVSKKCAGQLAELSTDGPSGHGGGVCLNGYDSSVTVEHDSSLSVTDALTIEAWVKIPEGSGAHSIVTKTHPTAPDTTYAFSAFASAGQSNDTLSFKYNSATSGDLHEITSDEASMFDGDWHHVAVTRPAPGSVSPLVEFYVDGVQKGGAASNTMAAGNYLPLIIGGDALPGTNLRGAIDEVRISDIVRSPSEFCLTSVCTSDANTVGLWHFDDVAARIATDSSSNGNDGGVLGSGCGVLPGKCRSAVVGTIGACVNDLSDCRVCLMLSAADGLPIDCDQFDDGEVNGSCVNEGLGYTGSVGEIGIFRNPLFGFENAGELLWPSSLYASQLVYGRPYDGYYGEITPVSGTPEAIAPLVCDQLPTCVGGVSAGAACSSDSDCGAGVCTVSHSECSGGKITDLTEFTSGTVLLWHPLELNYKIEVSSTVPSQTGDWQDAVIGQYASTTLKANKVYKDALHTFHVFPAEATNFWLRMYPLPSSP